ncbi:hypothetical protein BC936DRAFT_148416 [Jimgerdemannia flammicorona]|uniref:Aldehyde dehydrogenase domain-containing protein n=1 Tax=Jimgerdemannia flammicorona TaxID=994334 RepID=A0A433DKK1_9FUNG|nr:hypothetical protein BC936DRAFT_148416 [Jimgerdemannia flammicorona]
MSTHEALTVISPIDASKLLVMPFDTTVTIDAALERSATAFQSWRRVPVSERVAIVTRFAQTFEARRDEVVQSIVRQMGRPIRYGAGEIKGTLQRARYMTSIAEESLKDIVIEDEDSPGFRRFIRREPLGGLN